MKQDKDLLLECLASAMQKFGYNITMSQFNQMSDRVTNERTYRRLWGTWRAAKDEALKLLDGVDKQVESKVAVKTTPVFDFDSEQSVKTIAEQRKEIIALKRERLSTEEVRRYIFGLKDAPVAVPEWVTVDRHENHSAHGVPVLMISDWHYGEVVQSEQVFGVNSFGLDEADSRIRFLADGAIDILMNHLPSNYPGMVVVIAGDMISGNIHKELMISNEEPVMPIVLRVYNNLIWFITQMKQVAKNIHLFCVHGNHARTFRKPINKDSALSSYDWLVYTLLDRWFKDDKAINFSIASGDDLQFKIYDHRYRLTHGAQFRGGTGFIGSLAPIVRGEVKKRTTAETLGVNYDTLLMGHFHQYMKLPHVVANGSLVGYSEYSFNNNFPYERPQQALWLTHPTHGITFSCPIFCTKDKIQKSNSAWVSWKEQK